MRFKLLIFTCLMCFVCITNTQAQRAKLERANKYYKALNYQKAIQYYLDVLDKREIPQAKIKVADSYRKIGNMSEAAYWYGQVVRLPEAKPVHKLYYAQALQATDKCEQADKWFKEYSNEVPDDERGQLLRNACEEEVVNEFKTSSADYYRTQQVEDVNTSLDEFGASFFRQGIVFTSERDRGAAIRRIHTWTGDPFLELYYAEIEPIVGDESYAFKVPVKYSSKINTKFHDGPVSFNKKQNRIYFTRNDVSKKGKLGKDNEGVTRLKIFTARLENNEWTNIKGMPFNSSEYSVAHPTITPDGSTMYFTSDMPGGTGGMDLYTTNLENGRWGPAINMNAYVPGINTEGNEIFPFIHDDGTLYFASDGHAGMGGLDIHYTKNVNNSWSPVINMGAPINSINDDFSLVLSEDKSIGFYSSNREGGVGNDDLYMFQRQAVDVELLVYDKNTGQPLEDAKVDMNCSKRGPLRTGGDGKVYFEMPLDRTCRFEADKETYTANSAAGSTKGFNSGDRLFVNIPLDRPLEFKLMGKAISGTQVLSNVELIVTNDCGEPVQTMKTDIAGQYAFDLKGNCCYLIKGQKTGYLTNTSNVCTRGLTSSETIQSELQLSPVPVKTEDPVVVVDPKPTQPFPNPPPRPLSFPKLYHDFDKAPIQELYKDELYIIYNLLEVNPTVLVEVASFTDARGPAEYNQMLSERRAKETKKALEEKGIETSRIEARGYGESQPVNECVDGVKCTELKHQENRRTEVRVVGSSNQ